MKRPKYVLCWVNLLQRNGVFNILSRLELRREESTHEVWSSYNLWFIRHIVMVKHEIIYSSDSDVNYIFKKWWNTYNESLTLMHD